MPSPSDPVLQFDSIEDTIQAFSTLLPICIPFFPLIPLIPGDSVAFPREGRGDYMQPERDIANGFQLQKMENL